MRTQSKEKKAIERSLNKSQTHSKSKSRKTISPSVKPSKLQAHADATNNVSSQFKKKTAGQLVKKKIEDLKSPDLLIRVCYKGKKLSLPISHCNEKGLKDTVMPHIIRFESEILHNPNFSPSSICNWKMVKENILMDYYFQTNKPLDVFKGEIVEIEPIMRRKTDKVGLSDFQIIKCIGTGGFSKVFLARLIATGAFYALKLMEKQGLQESQKECVVLNEREIMVGLNSPFVLNLEFAFETKHFVALALEYCPGGELFYYLRRTGKMNENDARYCFIEILLGLQYLHSKNIIYRDIKPENIMIDMDGNLKIADFGLSKSGMRADEMAYTYCGSPQYMAPEMLTKAGHNFTVDYYCLGALLYELVTGNPPFYSHDVEKIYDSIQNDQIDFPKQLNLSIQLKMLLQGLLAKDPKRRLGSMVGMREILGHPWVRKLKSTDVVNKVVPTPIKIDLLHFNINEEDIEDGKNSFNLKFADEDSEFEPLFEDFYFDRFAENKILEEALPSVKSDSTKENKSSKQIPNNKSVWRDRIGQCKSANSHERGRKFPIRMAAEPECLSSEIRHESKKLKKQGSRKQMCIEPSKRRTNKSIVKVKEAVTRKTELKRIKSSVALLGGINRLR